MQIEILNKTSLKIDDNFLLSIGDSVDSVNNYLGEFYSKKTNNYGFEYYYKTNLDSILILETDFNKKIINIIIPSDNKIYYKGILINKLKNLEEIANLFKSRIDRTQDDLGFIQYPDFNFGLSLEGDNVQTYSIYKTDYWK